MEIINNNSPIVEFYSGKTVFITGATGFMGKVLVEKLLRSTNVKTIYLLIRPKKGVQTELRLKTLMESSVFDRIRKSSSDLMDKVIAINGDITEENFGLDEDSQKLLAENVSIVFHSAATVRFDEDLTKSVSMNIKAVSTVLSLAREMKHLEALVDVSTAYCNCDLKYIEEKIYKAPVDPHAIIDLCRVLDAGKLNRAEITGIVIGDKPNTYTFTKALAENILAVEGRGLPIAIIRPSIVAAAWRDPFPGWVDNFNAATGVLAGAGKGIMRTAFIKRDCVADMVPVDVCINLMCVLAWKAATSPASDAAEPPVYNCTSGGVNPLTWGRVETEGLPILIRNPYEGVFWYPGGSYKENYYVNRLFQLWFHYGPAQLVDLVYRLMGKKPFLVKISSMMQKSQKALEPFTTNSWEWSHGNMDKLWEELGEEDRDIFPFDIRDLDWIQFLETYVQGIRKFLFKEKDSTIPASKKHLNFLWCLDIVVRGLFFYGLVYFVTSFINYIF